MEKSYNNHKYLRIAIAVLLVMSVLLIANTVHQAGRVRALSQQAENHYMAAFSDLCDYIDDIDVLTKKALLARGEKQVSTIATQIFMEAASAKANISQLPLSDVNLDNTSKFLVQTGDYMLYLSSKVKESGEVTEEDFKNISALSDYAEKISGDLETLRERIYSGEISFSQNENIMAEAEKESGFPSEFSNIENEFIEYPSLIYDGPFSEHLQNRESVFLKYQGQTTGKMALRAAKELLGEKLSEGLELDGECGGVIEAYILKREDKERNLHVAITKQGSKLLWMIDTRDVGAAKINVDEARIFAKAFLEQTGYTNMKESYYEKNGNVATINYAYMQDGVTAYADLIKVKVALDNGDVLGIEANGYLMNHKEREFAEEIISEDEARELAGNHLRVDEINRAMIPLESGEEVLCYELRGAFKDRNYLIYINAQTGEDEKIMMLIESPDGILTV